MLMSCISDPNFLYQVEASADLRSWSTNGMPAAVVGNGAALILSPPINATPTQFFRVSVKPNF